MLYKSDIIICVIVTRRHTGLKVKYGEHSSTKMIRLDLSRRTPDELAFINYE